MSTIEQTRNYRRLGNTPIIPVPSANIGTPKELNTFYRTGMEKIYPPDTIQKIENIEAVTPYNYKVYLTQSGTTAPVASVVLIDTITGLVWTRVSGGTYNLTKTGAFVLDKIVPYSDNYVDVNGNMFTIERIDNNTLQLKSYDSGDLTTPVDGVLNNQYFNIEIQIII